MTGALAGRVVVVTRPAAQAERFAALVSAAGGEPLLLPAIAIEPLTLDAEARARLAPDGFDWTIYTSANAVECSLRQLPRPQRTRIAVVGRATARALEAQGLAADAMPHTTADSEGLLALADFADLRGRRVLILKGSGGRTLLREELARRGAEVVLGDVYRRRRATAEPAAVERLRRSCDEDRAVVAATSAEVLAGLLELVPEESCPRLRDAPLVVPAGRVADVARDHGWRGPITVAASAEDVAMAHALVRAGGPGSGPVGA